MAEGINETLIANAIGGGDPTDIRKKLIYAMLQGSTDTSPTNIPGGLNRIGAGAARQSATARP